MIVRDESEMLPGCLDSVKDVVDEIVLVDTGSNDNTVELARQRGARVYEQPWGDSFSQARNVAIDYATGDWILILDADERLTISSAKDLRAILAGCAAEGLRVTVRDHVRDLGHSDFIVNTSTRVFRNRSEYRYERRVHEQIDAAILSAKLGLPPVTSSLVIDHYGYLKEVVTKKEKRQRNLRLAALEAQQVGDGFSYYNLGVEYIRHERYTEALTALDKTIAMLEPSQIVVAEAYHRKAICLMEMSKFREALALLDSALNLYPDFTDLVFQKGEALGQIHRYHEAILAFKSCRDMGDTRAGYYSVQGVGGYRAAYAIGLVYHVLRNFTEALNWYRQSLKENPSQKAAVLRIAEVLRDSVPTPQLESELLKYFDLTTVEARALYLEVLFSVDRHESVVTLATELLSTGVVSFPVLARAAMSALHAGQWDKCIAWAGELARQNIGVTDNLLLIIVSCWAKGDLTSGQQAIGRLSQEKLDMLRAVCQQMQWYREGRDSFSLSINFANSDQNLQFHDSVLKVLRLVVITRDRHLLSQLLPILSPLEGHKAWLQLGLYYYRYDQEDLAWAELLDCERKGTYTAESLFVLGKIAVERRAYRTAVDYLYRCLELEPHLIEGRQLLVHACRQLGRNILMEGIERFPDAQVLVDELRRLKGEDNTCG